MAVPDQPGRLLQRVRSALAGETMRGESDGHLLGKYRDCKDEDAFAALVHRHNRLVWSVCRRILRNEQDAEDAFQATFLLLATKADTIQRTESVGSWLYGAACRAALQARRVAARRRTREAKAATPDETAGAPDESWRDLQAVLDEELIRMPEDLRAPFVLCCLEDNSKSEAAARLGWNVGTVSSRLARGRQWLRDRLSKRGVSLASVLVGLALARTSSAGVVPGHVVLAAASLAWVGAEPPAAGVQAIAAGVGRAALVAKGRTALACLAVGGVVCGLGTWAFISARTDPPITAKSGEPPTGEPARANPAGPELVALQGKVRATTDRMIATVVAVRAPHKPDDGKPPPVGASGVIVSADGLILSQYHVSHRTGSPNWEDHFPAGTRTTVTLSDGTEAEAELLGADPVEDLSLLRLVKPGTYPHAELGAAPALGGKVLKLGHPLGYQPGRPPVVRLGHVVGMVEDLFVTDCPISGGDSGGPYFALDGKLLGIPRNSAVPAALAEPGAVAQARGVTLFTATPAGVIRARLTAMKDGTVASPTGEEARARQLRLTEAARKATVLPADRWTQGRRVLAEYTGVAKRAEGAVVAILDGADPVALGTVVDAAGFVLTKASELPVRPFCRTPSDTIVPATVVGIDPATDLALLKVDAEGLRAIEWAERADPTAGTLLVAPGPDGRPVAAGVVGTPRRDLPGPSPTTVDRPVRGPAGLPEVLGSPVRGRGYWVEHAEGAAAIAGVRPGDLIVGVGGTRILDHADLAACVAGRRAGERVTVRLSRAGQALDVGMTLRGTGPAILSGRRAGFPTVFDHDLPLLAQDCGGPVLGLDGKAVGVTIARADLHGCLAIPADRVRALLAGLKQGKPLAALPPVAADVRPALPAPAADKPVTLTVEDVKRRLTERGDRFRSLLVEYDVQTEPVVEPRKLAEWGLHMVRDEQERHRFAFAGAKRLSEVTRPGVVSLYVPLDKVAADPRAPADTARRIEDARRRATSEKEKTGRSQLFLGTDPGQHVTRYSFDGRTCYAWDPFRRKAAEVDPAVFTSLPWYLIGLGLRPADPGPAAARPESVRATQEQGWFPRNFERYETAVVRPTEQLLDGAGCVVVAGEYHRRGGRAETVTETLWLDPALGFAPRKWETRADGVLDSVWTFAQYEEFAPGCWLPLEASRARGTPPWVPVEYRDQPAYRTVIRLRRAQVNDVRDDVFRP